MSPQKSGLSLSEGKEIAISVRSISKRDEMLWIAGEPPETSAFPPCIKAIIARGKNAKDEMGEAGSEEKTEKSEKKKGKHRMAAILASFLGQAGYSREKARQIWSQAAAVDESIFEKWFAKMHCPKCRALQRQSRGYPEMGIADTGLCQPDEQCAGFEGPVEYACRIGPEDERRAGTFSHIKTQYLVRFFDWSTGKESEIELTEEERSGLEAQMAELAGRKDSILTYARVMVRGRLRPRFYLREQVGPRRQMLSDII